MERRRSLCHLGTEENQTHVGDNAMVMLDLGEPGQAAVGQVQGRPAPPSLRGAFHESADTFFR